jgi:hypothetical protein
MITAITVMKMPILPESRFEAPSSSSMNSSAFFSCSSLMTAALS